MTVLVACAHPALQRSLIHALTAAGHRLRLLISRDPTDTEEQPSADVETIVADAPSTVYDAARDADAAVVIEPSVTSRSSRNTEAVDLVERALEAGETGALPRIVRVAGWSARGTDGRRGEKPSQLVTVRSAPVYGISDDPITLFLIVMRSLPAVPLMSDAHACRPVWHGDFSRALATVLDLPASELATEMTIAGPDRVTHADLYDRIAALIDRRPLRVPVPDFLAAHGGALADALKLPLPFDLSCLTVADADGDDDAPGHALASPFGVRATGLDEGLRQVVRDLEELPASEGMGTLEVKRFSIDIEGTSFGPADLMDVFRRRFRDVMPILVGVEPAAPSTTLNEGSVITMALPGRGHVQVRVEEVEDDCVVVATLRGHALAGIVRFAADAIPGGARFEVMTCDRAANALDWLTLTLGGARLQDANWARVVQNVASLAGGTAGPLQSEARRLGKEEARGAQRWIGAIIDRHRARRTPPASSTQSATS